MGIFWICFWIIKQFNNNNWSANIGQLIKFNNQIFFGANDGVNGLELWTSDGTPSGTNQLKDINIGSNSSSPRDFFIFNEYLYFTADDGLNGREIWKSDGTPSGTSLLKNINPTGNGLVDTKFIFLNNYFYFGKDNIDQNTKIESPFLNSFLNIDSESLVDVSANNSNTYFGLKSKMIARIKKLEYTLGLQFENSKEIINNSFIENEMHNTSYENNTILKQNEFSLENSSPFSKYNKASSSNPFLKCISPFLTNPSALMFLFSISSLAFL